MADASRVVAIGAVSRRTGCPIETIRYYEKIALLPKPARTAGGHRLYRKGEVERLSFILRCRQLGFAIDEIRALLDLVDGGENSCTAVKAITEERLVDVRRKIADLRKLEGTLADMVAACGTGQVPDCPVIEALHAKP
ncbi:MAG: helix-turn-helix domain-containing protein [Alphaproteobacteria bacterium]|jgi:MerR family mercuric resistance operon transcriptional regulator|nr:helix-turn-helix domain-containing protein [Alphaproteobacteria bacterium]MDP6566857.1 helix-turn-helix domain-containing protein [Alphaproteobacteria bacterium]MDP6813457.1 helix-turn-helix domain-containing protein [Alphaproteobacteria bacterium]